MTDNFDILRPFRTVWNKLVHPKNTLNYEEASQCIYEIACKNCDKVYVGETGRNVRTRLNEQRKMVETKDTQRYTRKSNLFANTSPRLQITLCEKTMLSTGRMSKLSVMNLTAVLDGSRRLWRYAR